MFQYFTTRTESAARSLHYSIGVQFQPRSEWAKEGFRWAQVRLSFENSEGGGTVEIRKVNVFAFASKAHLIGTNDRTIHRDKGCFGEFEGRRLNREMERRSLEMNLHC